MCRAHQTSFLRQLEEFLKEVQVDYGKQGFLETTLHSLRQVQAMQLLIDSRQRFRFCRRCRASPRSR